MIFMLVYQCVVSVCHCALVAVPLLLLEPSWHSRARPSRRRPPVALTSSPLVLSSHITYIGIKGPYPCGNEGFWENGAPTTTLQPGAHRVVLALGVVHCDCASGC